MHFYTKQYGGQFAFLNIKCTLIPNNTVISSPFLTLNAL